MREQKREDETNGMNETNGKRPEVSLQLPRALALPAIAEESFMTLGDALKRWKDAGCWEEASSQHPASSIFFLRSLHVAWRRPETMKMAGRVAQPAMVALFPARGE